MENRHRPPERATLWDEHSLGNGPLSGVPENASDENPPPQKLHQTTRTPTKLRESDPKVSLPNS